MSMLKVVIGIIFVLLLLSLLATTIMELLASILGLRGKNLEKALKNMLASTDMDEQLIESFKKNSLYKQLSYKYSKKRQNPSYLSDESFQSILFDVILKGEKIEKLEEKIDELPNDDLKNVLKQLLEASDHRLDEFKIQVRGWYNSIMDRASGWYKRSTQKILIYVGLIIAVVFNADTLGIYERLESNPETLQQIVGLAEAYAGTAEEPGLVKTDPDFEESMSSLRNLLNNEIAAVKSPLGLGWKNVKLSTITFYDGFVKVLGWLVTALAISLGAPFWFDLLRKMVNIRQAGKNPSEK